MHEQVAIAALDSCALPFAESLTRAVARRFPESIRARRLQVRPQVLQIFVSEIHMGRLNQLLQTASNQVRRTNLSGETRVDRQQVCDLHVGATQNHAIGDDSGWVY